MKSETVFRTALKKEIENLFPKCMILDNDPNRIQGIPDIIILHGKNWAALETKRFKKASRQPNQSYYIDLMNTMSYAAFICPENKQEVLDELQRSFRPQGTTRIVKSKSISLD